MKVILHLEYEEENNEIVEIIKKATKEMNLKHGESENINFDDSENTLKIEMVRGTLIDNIMFITLADLFLEIRTKISGKNIHIDPFQYNGKGEA